MSLDEKEKHNLIENLTVALGVDDLMVITGRLLDVDEEGIGKAYEIGAFEVFGTDISTQGMLEMALMAIASPGYGDELISDGGDSVN